MCQALGRREQITHGLCPKGASNLGKVEKWVCLWVMPTVLRAWWTSFMAQWVYHGTKSYLLQGNWKSMGVGIPGGKSQRHRWLGRQTVPFAARWPGHTHLCLSLWCGLCHSSHSHALYPPYDLPNSWLSSSFQKLSDYSNFHLSSFHLTISYIEYPRFGFRFLRCVLGSPVPWYIFW